jgi:hypothetical protein
MASTGERSLVTDAPIDPGIEEGLYIDKSPSSEIALEELAVLMRQLGYVVPRKRVGESTLRVYPIRYHQYPLLNPRFVDDASNFLGLAGLLDADSLVISVLSKISDPDFAGELASFSSTASCAFIDEGSGDAGEYYLYGHFVLPTTFIAADKGKVDLSAFHAPLSNVLDHLRKCRIPRDPTPSTRQVDLP